MTPPDTEAIGLRSKISVVKTLAQGICAVGMPFLGGLLGRLGTYGGVAAGACLAALIPTIADHYAGEARERVKKRKAELEAAHWPEEAAQRRADAEEGQRQRRQRFGKRPQWQMVAASFALIAGVVLVCLTSVEALAHNSVSGIVQGRKEQGFTLPIRHARTQPVVPVPDSSFTPVPTLSSAPAITETPSPRASVSQPSPSPSPGTVSPSASTSPSSSPVVTPSAVPSQPVP
jgi:hypothetical protein